MQRENQWIRHLSTVALGSALLLANGAAAQEYVKQPAEAVPPIVIVGGEPAPAAPVPDTAPVDPQPRPEAPATAPVAPGPPPPSAPQAAPPSAPQGAPPSAPEPVPTAIEPQPAVAQPAVAQPAVAQPAIAQPAIAPAPPAADPGPPVFSIGLSGLLSGARIGGEIDLHSMSGLDLALHLSSWLYVGARRVGVAFAAPASGDRYAIGGSPMVGFTWALGEVVALFGEAGAALQWRFGDQLDGAIGLAPFAGLGARFRLADWISLALEGAAHVPVTDAFTLQNAVLPQGAVEVSGGLGVLSHIR